MPPRPHPDSGRGLPGRPRSAVRTNPTWPRVRITQRSAIVRPGGRTVRSARSVMPERPGLVEALRTRTRPPSGASPSDISSAMISFGETANARASASICCSPPDRLPARCVRRGPARESARWPASMAPGPFAAPLLCDGHAQVVDHREAREDPRPSGMYVSPSCRMRWAGKPVDVTAVEARPRPALGGTRPDTARANVLLPAPLVPSTASTVPGATSRRPRRAPGTCRS